MSKLFNVEVQNTDRKGVIRLVIFNVETPNIVVDICESDDYSGLCEWLEDNYSEGGISQVREIIYENPFNDEGSDEGNRFILNIGELTVSEEFEIVASYANNEPEYIKSDSLVKCIIDRGICSDLKELIEYASEFNLPLISSIKYIEETDTGLILGAWGEILALVEVNGNPVIVGVKCNKK